MTILQIITLQTGFWRSVSILMKMCHIWRHMTSHCYVTPGSVVRHKFAFHARSPINLTLTFYDNSFSSYCRKCVFDLLVTLTLTFDFFSAKKVLYHLCTTRSPVCNFGDDWIKIATCRARTNKHTDRELEIHKREHQYTWQNFEKIFPSNNYIFSSTKRLCWVVWCIWCRSW